MRKWLVLTAVGFAGGLVLTLAGYPWAALYLIGYVSVWKPCCWTIYKFFSINDPDHAFGELVLGVVVGSLVALAWPLVLVGVAGSRIYHRHAEAITAAIMPRSAREERARRLAYDWKTDHDRIMVEEAREDYVKGNITMEELEQRLEKPLRREATR